MHKPIYELLFSRRYLRPLVPADLLKNKLNYKKNYSHYEPCLLPGVEKSRSI